MPDTPVLTIAQAQVRLEQLLNQDAVLIHLIEHLQDEFMSTAGVRPRRVLLTPNKSRVPESDLEVIVSWISSEAESGRSQIAELKNVVIPPTVPVVDPEPASAVPPPPVPPPSPSPTSAPAEATETVTP
jgi:hypothetical protein